MPGLWYYSLQITPHQLNSDQIVKIQLHHTQGKQKCKYHLSNPSIKPVAIEIWTQSLNFLHHTRAYQKWKLHLWTLSLIPRATKNGCPIFIYVHHAQAFQEWWNSNKKIRPTKGEAAHSVPTEKRRVSRQYRETQRAEPRFSIAANYTTLT